MLSQEQVRSLGQLLDVAYGSHEGRRKSSTSSFTTNIDGEMLIVTYRTIRNFASEQDQWEQSKDFDEESAKLTNDFMKNLKKDFKTLSGTSLKLKDFDSRTEFEVVGVQSHINQKRVVHCKRITIFEITN